MGDITSSNCRSSFTSPLLTYNHPQVVHITYFIPAQKSCNASFTTHSKFTRTLVSQRVLLPINLLASSVATGESHTVDNGEEEAASLLQPASDCDGGEEETLSTSTAETSLILATLDNDKEDSLAGFKASEVRPDMAETLQTEDTHTLPRILHVHSDAIYTPSALSEIMLQTQKEKMMIKKTQQLTYLFAAVASSLGISSLAGASVYCRFAWQMQGGEVPWTEMCGTFSLALGAAVGMEYWARWAHRTLWHASLWSMHQSHHQPRDGPFELNDVFAIINAIPAIALTAFGFLNKGLVPGLCLGAGLGITVFGIAYMFVHDGLVHRRFPVGPIADVPYFQKVAAAHQLHHADTFNGVPYGLFLGLMELEEVGGRTELEKVLRKRKRENKNPITN